jgi:hypothetical protein
MSWREIYARGGFRGRQLVYGSSFSSAATEREARLGVGQGPLEELDMAGALQPIAFANTASIGYLWDPSLDLERLTFREDVGALEWSEHAWDADGHPHTSPHYSHWQLLYVDDVISGQVARVGLEVLLVPPEEQAGRLQVLQRIAQTREEWWRDLDSAWRPLMKLLVLLQSRFLPLVTNSSPVLYREREEVWVYDATREGWDSRLLADEMGLEVDALHNAYWFLVERGIDRDPRDGLLRMRRSVPRSRLRTWRGQVVRAQDNFDAAELLRQFAIDLAGEPPPRTPRWPMEGVA